MRGGADACGHRVWTKYAPSMKSAGNACVHWLSERRSVRCLLWILVDVAFLVFKKNSSVLGRRERPPGCLAAGQTGAVASGVGQEFLAGEAPVEALIRTTPFGPSGKLGAKSCERPRDK